MSGEEERREQRKDENSIFIGNKGFMNYVTGVVMQFTSKGSQEVVIKARGKFISKAVDVSEVVSKRFLENAIELKGIEVGSDEFTNDQGKQLRVSFIEITLKKK